MESRDGVHQLFPQEVAEDALQNFTRTSKTE